jgi:hypothetical protein
LYRVYELFYFCFLGSPLRGHGLHKLLHSGDIGLGYIASLFGAYLLAFNKGNALGIVCSKAVA